MELKDFIGKTVINTETKGRFKIDEIISSEIVVVTEKPKENGYHSYYGFCTSNGDPISKGVLVFEDPSLKAPFIKAYMAYCRTEEARWEAYGYWLMRE